MVTTTTDAEVNELSTASATPSLNDAAKANRETGLLLATKEQLVTAIQDRRLLRVHLRVLACVAGYMNTGTGKAWPGRAAIANLLGVSAKSVSNILLELRNFGYLIAERERVAEADNRSLMVYTWGKIDHDTIRRELEHFVQGVREGKIPIRHHSDESPSPLGQSQPARTSKSQPVGTFELKVPAGRAPKSQPAGDSNSSKGTRSNIRANAPNEASLKEIIWRHAIAWLGNACGLDEDKVRSRLGKLIKEHGQGLVLDALAKAQEAKPLAPFDYMTQILAARRGGGSTTRSDFKRKLDTI
jgi:hypothetical protein